MLGLLAGCEAVDDEPGSELRVEQYHHGSYYAVAFDQVGNEGEFERATGAVIVPTLDPVTHQQVHVGSDAIRATCGVTFVSNKHAITAAHCVDGDDVWDPANQTLSVEMYKVDPDLEWWDYTQLLGTFPNFSSPLNSLDASDGYEVESFDCKLVARCGGNDWGPMIQCNLPEVDLALLECDGEPGDEYGYLDAASSDAPGDPVYMPWKHEIYDIDPNNSDHFDHYSDYVPKTSNYHYFAEGQLLPVASKEQWIGDLAYGTEVLWPDSSGSPWTWTNLFGCHGTSGSGIGKREASGNYTLLGPVARGDQMAGLLCHPEDVNIFGPGMSYTDRKYTAEMVDNARCGEYERGLLMWLRCHRFRLPILVKFPDFGLDWPMFEGPPIEQWRVRNEPVAEYPAGERELVLPFGELPQGMNARVSVHAVALEGELDAPVELLVGGEAVARIELDGETRSGKLTAAFRVADPRAEISVRYDGERRLGLTEITVAIDQEVNALDSMTDRAGLGIVGEEGVLSPMRFVSDQRGGFAALLRRGETMAITRQAFVEGAEGWVLRMQAEGGAEGLELLAYDADGGEPIHPESLEVEGSTVTAVFYGVDLPAAITVAAYGEDAMIDEITVAPL